MKALLTADLQLGAGLTLGAGEFGPGSRSALIVYSHSSK